MRPEERDLSESVHRILHTNAEGCEDRIGDRNRFRREQNEPTTERRFVLFGGATILDAACGAGRFSRRLGETSGAVR